MSDRYHINPETGRANKCSAQKQCRFGLPLDKHYESADAARAGYEEKMSNETLPTVKKRGSARGAKVEKKKEITQSEAESALYVVGKIINRKADRALFEKILNNEKVSDEEIDHLLDENRFINKASTPSRQSGFQNVHERGQILLDYVRSLREKRGTPSTIPTMTTFDPSKQSLFVSDEVRNVPHLAVRAIERELLNAANYDDKSEKLSRKLAHHNTAEEHNILNDQANVNAYKADRARLRASGMVKELTWMGEQNKVYKTMANNSGAKRFEYDVQNAEPDLLLGRTRKVG